MRVFALVALAACVDAMPTTERMPIEYVGRGSLEKGGVAVDGFTCGETYSAAVTGVPEAEREIRACWQANVVYGAGILGSLALVPVAITTAHEGGPRALVDVEVGAIATSFLIGYVAAWIAGNHLNNAIHVYNRAVR
ncbi:MAG TPA: hypothetical protein VGG28_08530 [Kofleriaceae bacterium]|jgi:hypothetical protein